MQDLLYALDANRALLAAGVKLAIPRTDARFPEADLKAVLRLKILPHWHHQRAALGGF